MIMSVLAGGSICAFVSREEEQVLEILQAHDLVHLFSVIYA